MAVPRLLNEFTKIRQQSQENYTMSECLFDSTTSPTNKSLYSLVLKKLDIFFPPGKDGDRSNNISLSTPGYVGVTRGVGKRKSRALSENDPSISPPG